MREALIALIYLASAGMALFSFGGVIVLLRRTRRQSEHIAELRSALERLEPGLPAQKPDIPGDIESFQGTLDLVPAPERVEPAEEPVPAVQESPPLQENPSRWVSLKNFVHGGHLWAAGGVILLIAAFAMLITYLARRGFFTLEMGIAGAALSGMVMLSLGWVFRARRPLYFLLLQGGGIGILYLSVFAAHKLTPHFPPLISLILMSLLIPPALMLALFQNSQPLAWLGFLGGFAAPLLLASGTEGEHGFLFSYYTVLDLGVLVISGFRLWKGLNLLSFLCTFGAALLWVRGRYEPNLFWTVEPFCIGFMAIFTILGIRGIRKRSLDYPDGILIIGTPFLGALTQWEIFARIPHGHAIISILFAALYLGLVMGIWKRRERFGGEAIRPLAEGYLGLSVVLANVAIPLELAPEITSALWAAEAAAGVFLGLRLRNRRMWIGGILLHIAGAIAFALGNQELAYGRGAFRSPPYIGSLIIALSALVIMVLLHRFSGSERTTEETAPPENETPQGKTPTLPLMLTIWALLWWFGGWLFEFQRLTRGSFTGSFFGLDQPWGVFFILSSLTALGVFFAARYFRCPWLNLGSLPSLIIALLLVLGTFLERTGIYLFSHPTRIFTYNFLYREYLWGWLVFFGAHTLILILSRRGIKGIPEETLPASRHGAWLFTVILIALGTLSSSGRMWTVFLGLSESWRSLAGILPSLGALMGLSFLSRSVSGLSAIHRKLLCRVLPRMLCGVLGLWFLVTLFLPGNPSPLPFYIPILNPLDIQQGFCIAGILLWLSLGRKNKFLILGDTMVFLWITAIIARGVHFYGRIEMGDLLGSPGFHLGIFICWAFYGIVHIILGHRLSLRPLWIAGAILTAADIGKLLLLDLAGTGAIPRIISFFIAGLILLFIGWAAPLPPGAQPPPAEG